MLNTPSSISLKNYITHFNWMCFTIQGILVSIAWVTKIKMPSLLFFSFLVASVTAGRLFAKEQNRIPSKKEGNIFASLSILSFILILIAIGILAVFASNIYHTQGSMIKAIHFIKMVVSMISWHLLPIFLLVILIQISMIRVFFISSAKELLKKQHS